MDTDKQRVRSQVRELLCEAIDSFGAGRFAVPAERWAQLLTEVYAAAPDTSLAEAGAVVREGVQHAWRIGWEPADLHRLARNRLATQEQKLLADAIADELGQYAPATIDARWPEQLEEIGARRWWPADTTYLRYHARRFEAFVVWSELLAVLTLVASVPPVQPIGPAPGDARVSRARPAGPGVDDRLLRRVRGLLAKAESTTYAAEAETYTAAAQALIARYSIDAALLAATTTERGDGPIARRVGLERPYEQQKATLLAEIADANRCRTVWSKNLGFSTVVGHAGEVRAVEILFTSLLMQATRAMLQSGSDPAAFGRRRSRNFRQAFLYSFAVRIGERLRETMQEETELARRAAAEPDRLLPALAARSLAVDDAVSEMFPDIVSSRVTGSLDAEGWAVGRSAADLARLGGQSIEGASAG